VSTATTELTPKDFRSGQEVRWCPGCGDHTILTQVRKVLPTLGVPPEKIVFVSGIGCSSRFPYYVNTYGFHGIHGRAPSIAMGIKCANPALSVWVVTGDGDGLSIGTNHLIHAMRRNIDINILLFNNRIYGLTKGQYSPTSEFGTRSKSSPWGSIEQPLSPIRMALAAEATFVARAVYADVAHLGIVLEAAARHKGVSFVEILQNCSVFNDGAYTNLIDRSQAEDSRVHLEHGQPVRFGAAGRKGIGQRNMAPCVIDLDQEGSDEREILIHDTRATSPALASLLASLEPPAFPTALGIFRDVEKPTYDALLTSRAAEVVAKKGQGDLDQLLQSGTVFEVR